MPEHQDQPPSVIDQFTSSARQLARGNLRTLHVAAGTRVFKAGDSCSNYLVVKKGAVRVAVMTESGREILLYKVEPGESCVLTVSCLMSGHAYEAEGVAETDTEAYVLPKPMFDDLLALSPEFRRFVFTSYGERIHALIGLIQEIAVRHMDRKLARLLLARRDDFAVLMTHQALAAELNTAREVVSRLLNEFSDRGWVELGRGRIVVADEAALERLSKQM